MASTEIVQKSVEATFDEIKSNSPEDYAKIEADPYLKEVITEAATSTAGEEVAFDREFLQNPGEEVVSLLTGTLPLERIQLIQEALTILTFDMTLEIIPRQKKRRSNRAVSPELTMGDEDLGEFEERVSEDYPRIEEVRSVLELVSIDEIKPVTGVEGELNHEDKLSSLHSLHLHAKPMTSLPLKSSTLDRTRKRIPSRRTGTRPVDIHSQKPPAKPMKPIPPPLRCSPFDATLEIIPSRKERGSNDVMLAEFKMEDEEFLPPLEIETLDDIDRAKVLQYASIVIEAVMLAMQAAGIKVAVSRRTMKSAIINAAKKIKESSLMRKAMQTFVKSWRRAGSNNWAKARAVFFLLKDSQTAGLFWTIVKSLCKEMSWWDWLKTSAQVTAMIIAAFASGGAALIAKIFLALLTAARLVQKIRNVTKLEEFEQNLYESEE
ncbi:uncharacterized protein [Montipora capricornis]|uniref:uncharacterized protein n=1 Tax=Montipora capricornis TaxID=246305 RepID=UPI0035F1770E